MNKDRKEAAFGKRSDPHFWPVGSSYRLETAVQVEEDLEALARAGVRFLELAWIAKAFDMFDPVRERECEAIIQKARRRGLDIWTLHLPYGTDWDVSSLDPVQREQAMDRHLRLLSLAEQWGIRTAVLHPSWEPIPDVERSERLGACKGSLAQLAEQAAKHGVRLAVECLPRTCLGNTSAEMAELLSASDKLGICCDVNHLLQETPQAFIRKLGSRIYTVHISDNDGTDERHWMPGRGIIDWKEVLHALAEQGYDGPFLFEIRQPVPSELTACWERLLAAYSEAQGN
ncbi:sugar phosphate isomerase/epimerase [Paenibacillus sp. CC-CFT747]|nr:sugar phosphate isomerase/epimerase [Paenibacillus sp. CC-CFT747]